MARIVDERLLQGKRNRDKSIRRYFERRFKQGLRYEVIEEEIILKWGVSSSHINKVMKNDEKENKTNNAS